jgi:HAD superfamily, subfamily IIIB (Acid phosphatase)
MPTVCIIDIDTTLANTDHRATHLVTGPDGKITQESWDAFLHPEALVLDPPQKHALDVLNWMRAHGYEVVFLTGRGEKLRSATEAWLSTHMGWTVEESLYMRGQLLEGVPASAYKERMFVGHIKPSWPDSTQFLFFEDDPHVLPMFKKYGLVFQCPQAWEFMNPPEPPPKTESSWSR